MENYGASIKRILIIEDEPAIGEICQRTLTGEGFEVGIAVNGSVAQGMLGEKDYDLYLIDIRIPVMDGKELYQYMSEKYPELTKRVIFITGDVMGGSTQSFLELSGRPYLLKPFTPDELRIIVSETLKQIEK